MRGIQSLKIGISGMRAVVGESLTPQLVVGFAEAFGTYLNGGIVVIGRDTRPSGEMVFNALVGGLLSAGCSVVDVGICPVPTMQHAVVDLGADGGIAITASHNPVEWNALKFVRSDGVFLNSYQAEELLNVYHQGAFELTPSSSIGRVSSDDEAMERHLAKVVAVVQREAIAELRPRVVADTCNGAGAVCTRCLLESLGCEVVVINERPDGHFPRPPEPIPENLGQLCEAVREHKADVGFAQDADADRLAIVSAEGKAIGEEFTLAFAADVMADRRTGVLVTNLSSSRMIDEVGDRHGCRVVRSKVGEVNVVETMMAHEAIGGGEGNGGVIDPRLHYCRDSLVAMALVLEGMATKRLSVKAWTESFRPSAIVKDKVPCPAGSIQTVVLALQRRYQDEQVDLTEGVKVLWPQAWLHARPSNTEPIIRVIAEADDEATARGICDGAIEVVREAIG
jgi:phosphomannomutase